MSAKEQNKSNTLVNFVLDETGSMESVREATISSFNEYIDSLKKKKESFDFSLTLFNTQKIEKRYVNIPLDKVKHLSRATYNPGASTPLYDAVCQSIKEIEGTVKKDQKVLMVILTDGEENSSKEYTQEHLKKFIKRLTKTGKWSFIYLGANQDSWLNATKWGIPQGNTTNFSCSVDGLSAVASTLADRSMIFANSMNAGTTTFFNGVDISGIDTATAHGKTIVNITVDNN